MTAKAAICKALLLGKVLNVKNGFSWFGVTNIPREIGRAVERSFKVKVDRKKRDGRTRYGVNCWWTDYKLKIEGNELGVIRMIEYIVNKEGGARTQEQASDLVKLDKILNYCKSKI